MSKIILIVGAVGIVVLGAVYFFFQSSPQESPEPVTGGQETMPPSAETTIPEEEESLETTRVVVYSDSGYSPEELTIQKGDTVTFRNESSRVMWPATDIHPQHKMYPGSDIQKCFDGSDTSNIFDACGEVSSRDEWPFIFQEAGTWKYHDHRRPSETGTIIVEE